MWADVTATIRFQPVELERAKKATMSTLNHIFRDYKSKLNCQYVKKIQILFDKHGNISQQEWDEFVEQKTSSASKELSEKMVELNKRNKYKPRLGLGGYKKKILIWREQEAKLRVEGKPDPLPNTNDHTRNWVYGRSELTDEGEIIVKDPATLEVVQALKVPITMQTEAGLFTPEYHKDELAKAIGTKEHGGRSVQVQAPVIQVQPAPVVVKASVIPKMITRFDKEPKDPKAKSDIDKYLAALKKRLASTGKLVLQEEDPHDVLSYDDQILENPADDVDYPKFILGKPFISNNMYKNLSWEMRKLHDWYMIASKEGVTEITCRIPKEVFNEDDEQILYLFWEDVHLIFRLDQMDVTFITLWCMCVSCLIYFVFQA
ncbi:hypothetical protein QOZ80_7AG0570240 [Eleusine coracana subsp. coracana]|nr:hypothetical protein QOZ80_7AG0570240 [Eleusine coracana subsp. coracana]